MAVVAPAKDSLGSHWSFLSASGCQSFPHIGPHWAVGEVRESQTPYKGRQGASDAKKTFSI